jgi:hypothetical protein
VLKGSEELQAFASVTRVEFEPEEQKSFGQRPLALTGQSGYLGL